MGFNFEKGVFVVNQNQRKDLFDYVQGGGEVQFSHKGVYNVNQNQSWGLFY